MAVRIIISGRLFHIVRVLFLFLFTFAWPTLASQKPPQLPKVVVKASTLPDPLQNADVTHITAGDLEQQQAVTVVEALKRVPGAYVTQNGIGQEARVSLRGTGDSRTTVIVNGMPLNDMGGFDGAFDLSRWGLEDVSEIQVVRGPMSSLYGAGGMGGVILIETKKGKGPLKTFAKAEGGSFQTFSQMVGAQGQKDLMDYHVIGSRFQSAGTSITPKGFLSQIQGKPNNPLHQENVTARLGAGPDAGHISLFTRYSTRRLGYRPSPIEIYPRRIDFSESFHRLQGHFENATGRWSHDIGLGYYQNNLTNTHPLGDKVVRNGSQLQMDWRQAWSVTDDLQAQGVMDASHETLYSHTKFIPGETFKVSHGGVGGTISYRVHRNLTATGSVRVDGYQGVPSIVTYRFGGTYLFEKITLKGSVGTAFKAPTLQQKFYKGVPPFSGNPHLKPERSLGGEVGIERPFFHPRLVGGFTIFQNRIRDLIDQPGTTLVNIHKSRTQGIEGLIRFRPMLGWAVELSHTYTQAWDEKTGEALIDTPRHKTSFNVRVELTPEWRFSGNVLYISPRDTNDAIIYQRVKTPSYTIIGAETSYQLTDQWQVYGRGENLLDRRYQNPRHVQQPGLGLYAGIRAQW